MIIVNANTKEKFVELLGNQLTNIEATNLAERILAAVKMIEV